MEKRMGIYLNPGNEEFQKVLNMFDEYSMTNQRELAEFTSFTETEVQSLCMSYGMSYDRMKQWYDGYVSPESVSYAAYFRQSY